MILVVHVKPNSKQTRVISKLDDQTFAIALHAPATEGKANEELIDFLADKLNIPKTFINLKRGHNSRVKHLELPDGSNLAQLTS
jgi:hypothetical protein